MSDDDTTGRWEPADDPTQAVPRTGPGASAEPPTPPAGIYVPPPDEPYRDPYEQEYAYDDRVDRDGGGGKGPIIAVVVLLLIIAAVAGALWAMSLSNNDSPAPATTTIAETTTTTEATTTTTEATTTTTEATTTTTQPTTTTAATTTAPSTSSPPLTLDPGATPNE